MSNQEMVILLKTSEGRAELKQYLMGKLEDGFLLSNTELIFLVTINNMDENV